jgi:hypothetical protein
MLDSEMLLLLDAALSRFTVESPAIFLLEYEAGVVQQSHFTIDCQVPDADDAPTLEITR